MNAILTLIELPFDEEKPIADQLAAGSALVDYEMDEEDLGFLTTIAGLLWKDLNDSQKDRAAQWLLANAIYKGVANFDCSTVDPDLNALECPTCHSDDLSLKIDEGGADECIELCSCHSCGTVFHNIYRLTGQSIED
jgi:hypothetical protein